MKAAIGDLLRIRGHHIGEADRDAEILEVRGDEGAPPYLVRWDDGHVGLMFPSPTPRSCTSWRGKRLVPPRLPS
ncbi:MAG: DUF1918 domain-containing protein [Actinomycetota bacterium]